MANTSKTAQALKSAGLPIQFRTRYGRMQIELVKTDEWDSPLFRVTCLEDGYVADWAIFDPAVADALRHLADRRTGRVRVPADVKAAFPDDDADAFTS